MLRIANTPLPELVAVNVPTALPALRSDVPPTELVVSCRADMATASDVSWVIEPPAALSVTVPVVWMVELLVNPAFRCNTRSPTGLLKTMLPPPLVIMLLIVSAEVPMSVTVTLLPAEPKVR